MEKTVGKCKYMGEEKVMKCRNCYIEDDHWTSKCPLKLPNPAPKSTGPKVPGLAEAQSTKHNPKARSKRETSIKISNLPKCATTADLQELAKPFGQVKKRYLAKYKDTDLCKGYAFIHFRSRSEAAEAVKVLNGHKYGNLILNVDWSDPPAQNNEFKEQCR